MNIPGLVITAQMERTLDIYGLANVCKTMGIAIKLDTILQQKGTKHRYMLQ